MKKPAVAKTPGCAGQDPGRQDAGEADHGHRPDGDRDDDEDRHPDTRAGRSPPHDNDDEDHHNHRDHHDPDPGEDHNRSGHGRPLNGLDGAAAGSPASGSLAHEGTPGRQLSAFRRKFGAPGKRSRAPALGSQTQAPRLSAAPDRSPAADGRGGDGGFFLLLAGRLVQLQGFQSHTYATLAEEQRQHTVDQPAIRGEIVDRSGNVLAVDVDADDVYANPHKVTDVVGEATKLAPILHKPMAELIADLLPNANFRYLALDVDTPVGDKVTKLKLPGIGTLPNRKRLYPAGNLAANVLGVVGRDGGGLAGLESAYNTQLAGKNGTLVVEEDPQGRVIPSGTHREKAAVPGQGLQLTIDRDIQYQAEQALAAEVKASGAIKGVAIVMDPHTGAIYAMASAPGFNPNDPSKITPARPAKPRRCVDFRAGQCQQAHHRERGHRPPHRHAVDVDPDPGLAHAGHRGAGLRHPGRRDAPTRRT